MENIILEIITKLILGTVIISEVKNKRRLIKKNQYQNFKVIDKTPIIKKMQTTKRESIMNHKELEEIVSTFLNTLKTQLSKEEFNNIKYNLETLQYKKGNQLFIKISHSLGYYSARGHYIAVSAKKEIDTETFKHIIYHELLHAVTSCHHNKTYYTGFNQVNTQTNKQIGNLLNEGYTELLTKRLFGYNDNVGYEYEIAVAELVEFIIGIDEMKKLYFNMDLEGLINELSKYQDINKVKQFILNLDTIHSLYDEKGQYEKETLTKLYNDVSIFLYEAYQARVEQTINIHNLEFYEFISNKFIKLFNEVTRHSKFAKEERKQTIKELEKEEIIAYKEYIQAKQNYDKEEKSKSKKLVKKKDNDYHIFNHKGFINILTTSIILIIISLLSIGVSYLLLQAR